MSYTNDLGAGLDLAPTGLSSKSVLPGRVDYRAGYPAAERNEIVRAMRAAAMLRSAALRSRTEGTTARSDVTALNNGASWIGVLAVNAAGLVNTRALVNLIKGAISDRYRGTARIGYINWQIRGPKLMARVAAMEFDPAVAAAAAETARRKAAAEAAATAERLRQRAANLAAALATLQRQQASAAAQAQAEAEAAAAAKAAADARIAAEAAAAAKSADDAAAAAAAAKAAEDAKSASEAAAAKVAADEAAAKAGTDAGKVQGQDVTGSGSREIACNDGYYRDATGVCVANTVTPPPPEVTVERPEGSLVPPTPQELVPPPVAPRAGLFGVPWMYIGVGGAVAVGGYLLLRPGPTPNRRRTRTSRGRR